MHAQLYKINNEKIMKKNTLSALFNGDEVWHQICSEPNHEDLRRRKLIVKYCLKAKLYRPLFYIVKHKLRG